MGEVNSPLLESKRQWKQHGESGLWISDWLPHHSRIADELCVIRSCVSDGINHADCQMNTGSVFGGRPSLGSWVSYGLGTENQSLPGFVVIKDTSAMVVNGTRCWGNGFMPASHQGVLLENGPEPIANLKPRASKIEQAEDMKLSFLQSLNQRHLQGRESNSELEARIRSYELAAEMQMHAPESVDLEQESAATKSLYGLDDGDTKVFGQQCLLARRLVERGVRFVQLYHGAGSKWDSHTKMESNHSRLCRQVDLPIAGLVTDLKARGLLDETPRHLGRRIWPHADERERRRQGSQPDRLHHVDGRRRRQRRTSHRRNRRVGSACRKRQSTRPRFSCHHTRTTRPRSYRSRLHAQRPSGTGRSQRGPLQETGAQAFLNFPQRFHPPVRKGRHLRKITLLTLLWGKNKKSSDSFLFTVSCRQPIWLCHGKALQGETLVFDSPKKVSLLQKALTNSSKRSSRKRA